MRRVESGFGVRLRKARDSRGLSQRALAELSGVSSSYFTDVESGKRDIGAAILFAAARALEVDPVWLYTGDGEPDPRVRHTDFTAADVALVESWRALSKRARSTVAEVIQQLLAPGHSTGVFLAVAKREEPK